MPDEVADRLMTQAAGNPLALVELPTTLSGEQLAGAAPMPAQLHLTAGMERVFLDRCRRLPPPVQTLLLVAAADDSGQVATLRRAAAVLDVEPERPRRRGTVRAARRRRRQRARCGIRWSGPRCTRPRPAWNAAKRTGRWPRPSTPPTTRTGTPGTGPRPSTAPTRRSSPTWSRPARAPNDAAGTPPHPPPTSAPPSSPPASSPAPPTCSPPPATRGRPGRPRRRARLSAAARDLADDRVLRADIDRLRGRIEVNVGSGVDAHRIFATAVRAVAADDPARALELAVAAALMSTYGSDSGTTLDATALAAAAIADDIARTRCLGHLLLSLTQASAHEWAAGLASLRAALDAGADVADLYLLSHLGNAALHLGDEEAHRRCFTAMVAGARDAGAGMLVLYALPRLGFTQLVTGQWTALRSWPRKRSRSASAPGNARSARSRSAGSRCSPPSKADPPPSTTRCLADLDAAAGQPLGVLADPVHDLMRWAQGTRAAHDGDTTTALHHLASMRLSTLARLVALDRIDAAVRAGDREQAAVWVKQLVPFAEGTGWPWALAAVDHGRALLAEPGDAPALFESALAHHAHARRPPVRPGPDPPRVRGVPAPLSAPRRRAHPPAGRAGDLRGPAGGAAGRAGHPGAARVRGDRPQARPVDAAGAHADGTPGRRAGPPGHVEQGHRRPVLGVAPDRRVPPAEHLHQGRSHLPRRARPARPGVAVVPDQTTRISRAECWSSSWVCERGGLSGRSLRTTITRRVATATARDDDDGEHGGLLRGLDWVNPDSPRVRPAGLRVAPAKTARSDRGRQRRFLHDLDSRGPAGSRRAGPRLRAGIRQLPPITGAIILTGPPGASVDVTSIRLPVSMPSRTCAAVVNGCVARSMLPGVASTSRTSVHAPV